jgi:hypothetical protein
MNMKLILIPAVLMALLPAAPVRFESDGVRVGDDVVTEKAISLKSAGALPILVSGSTLENLSSTNQALEVAIADKSLLLDVGIRLDRQGEGYRLSTHGPAFSVEAGGKSIVGQEPVSFKVTDKGFDFGKQGTLEGFALTAKVALMVQATPQDPAPLPQTDFTRRRRPSEENRPPGIMRRVFGVGDPTLWSQAGESSSIRMLEHVTPTGSH